jgi:phytoene synthase
VLASRRDGVVDEARRTTRRVGRTFAIACRMLPRSLRNDVYLLYLVFRTLDDAVDEGRPDAEERVAAVERWAAGERARRGQVQSRARAPGESREAELLADLATRYPIPPDAVAEFCRGMRDDLEGRPIVSEQEVDRYCYRVAGTVGIVMASVLGVRRPEARQQAAALGMAMQRTNILRDIDEDLAYGRIYLARETLDRYGSLDPGAREQLVRDQIARADALYDQGIAGIPELRHGRRAIAAASAMYREILRQIEREGYGRVAGRAVVPRRRKVMLAARKVVLPS